MNKISAIVVLLVCSLALFSCKKDETTQPPSNNPPTSPSNPNPADGAVAQSTSPVLSWTCSDPDADSIKYDLYFGSVNPPNTLTASNWINPNYALSGLNLNTVYYWRVTARDSKGATTVGSIWRFTTTAGNITWTKYANNPVIDKGPAGSWDEVYVGPGGAILDGTTYKMWYWAETSTPYRKVQIGLATSPDGIQWTKYANNPVITENPASGNLSEPSASAPFVLKEGSVYKMWYRHERYISGVWVDTVMYATSSDGINWTKYITTLNRTGGNPNYVLKTNNVYRIWAGTITAISTDGINWSNQTNLSLPSGASGDQAIITDGSIYRMFFRRESEDNRKINEARSSDGMIFTEYGVSFTGGTGWDTRITGTKIVKVGNTLYMYYNGYNPHPNFKIGLATGVVQ